MTAWRALLTPRAESESLIRSVNDEILFLFVVACHVP